MAFLRNYPNPTENARMPSPGDSAELVAPAFIAASICWMTGSVVPAVVQNEKNLKKRRSIALPVIRLEEAASGPGSHHGLHREEH